MLIEAPKQARFRRPFADDYLGGQECIGSRPDFALDDFGETRLRRRNNLDDASSAMHDVKVID